MIKLKLSKLAFTLAEVLITIGIIVEIVALTLPTVLRKVRNAQLKENFKVAYSLMCKALENVSMEEDGLFVKKYLYYENKSEQCPNGCYPYKDYIPRRIYNELNIVGTCKYDKVYNFNKTSDKPYIDWGTAYPNMALSNGMCFNVYVLANLINFTIDTNGVKGPNIIGYDIFVFNAGYGLDKIYPKKMYKLYTDEEVDNLLNKNGVSYAAQQGLPCSYKSKQRGNGIGCSYYALIDQNPDNPTKKYWSTLP